MNKALFLDRDGTINVEKNYLYKIDEFELTYKAVEALKIFQKLDYILIVITNQSGIGRGYYTEEDFKMLNKWMLELLNRDGVNIKDVLYCPHHKEATIVEYKKDCSCRKPKTGLYYRSIEKYNIDIDSSILIGDKLRDLQLCFNTKAKGYLISENINEKIINKNILIKKNLYECAINEKFNW